MYLYIYQADWKNQNQNHQQKTMQYEEKKFLCSSRRLVQAGHQSQLCEKTTVLSEILFCKHISQA